MSESQRYLVAIAAHHFGPIVGQLIETLIIHGPLTLQAIARISHTFNIATVKKAVAIGLQHSIVTAQYERKGPAQSISTNGDGNSDWLRNVRILYTINDIHLRSRLRFPSYCVRVRSLYGLYSEVIVQSLALNGITSTDAILAHALRLLSSNHSDLSQSQSESSHRQALSVAMKQLLANQFVRKVLVSSSDEIQAKINAPSNDDAGEAEFNANYATTTVEPKKRKRGAAAAAAAGEEEEKEPTKKRGRAASKSKAAAPIITTFDTKTSTNSDIQPQSVIDAAVAGIELNGGDYYTINPSRFHTEDLRDAVVDFAIDRLGLLAGVITRAMLREYPVDYVKPPIVTLDRIVELTADPRLSDTSSNSNNQSQSSESFTPPNVTAIKATLLSMTKHESNFLRSLDTGYELHVPDWRAYQRVQHIPSILAAKYNPLCARIYRVLTSHQKLEETQIAEICTASRKSAREALHRLLIDEWITLTEVPRTSDRAPTKTFFLWSVDAVRTNERLYQSVLMTSRKLLERVEHESTSVSDIVAKVEMQRPIDESERASMERWKRATARLEKAQRQVQQILQVAFDQ